MSNSKKYLNLPKKKKIGNKLLPYLSYSQHTSFNETNDEFRYQMILQYIFGIKIPSRFAVFADYGTHCGEYIETQGKKRGKMLSDADCKVLDKLMEGFDHEMCEYEREIWIDRGNYFILGFEDRWEAVPPKSCIVEDFKTGSISKKAAFYASEEYGQTTLYAFAEEERGLKIAESYVTLLDRKGNPMSETDSTDLYLSGEIKKIPTPYSKERAEKVLTAMDETAKKLASLKTTYDVLSKLTFQL